MTCCPTRARGGTYTPNLLELVLTNELDMVDEVSYLSLLGNSDHQVLVFDLACNMDWSKPVDKHNFSKGNYDAARCKLQKNNIPPCKDFGESFGRIKKAVLKLVVSFNQD